MKNVVIIGGGANLLVCIDIVEKEDKYNIMMKQAAGIMANPNATHEQKEQYLQAIIDMIAGME